MGKIIQDFILQENLGSGSFGQVYKALNITTNQTVALKIIDKQTFKTIPKLEECLENEIKVLDLVRKSQHIINHYKAFKSQHNFYMVYQYCNGGTLHELLKKRIYLPETEALKIVEQLLEAFKELNTHHILHRDLKPENIFIHNEKIKLGDFGFSKKLEPSDPVTMTMIGSPIYMAPEVIKGEAYSEKADIWSLGVILYEMIYGECPFQSNSIAGLILSLHNNHINFPKTSNYVSDETIQLLTKMLQKDNFKRISWASLFQYFEKKKTIQIRPKNTKNILQRPFSVSIPYQRYSVTSLLQSQNKTPSESKLKFQKEVEYSGTDSTSNASKGSVDEQLNLSGRFQMNRLFNNYGKQIISEIQKIRNQSGSLQYNLSDLQKNHKRKIDAANLAVDVFIDDQKFGPLYYYLILSKVKKQLLERVTALSNIHSTFYIILIIQNEIKLLEKQIKIVKNYLDSKNHWVEDIFDVPTFLRLRQGTQECCTRLWNRMVNFFDDSVAINVEKSYTFKPDYTPKFVDCLFMRTV